MCTEESENVRGNCNSGTDEGGGGPVDRRLPLFALSKN